MLDFIRRLFRRQPPAQRLLDEIRRERARAPQPPTAFRGFERRAAPPADDGYVTSAAIAAATGDPLLGYAVGGNPAGALLGAAAADASSASSSSDYSSSCSSYDSGGSTSGSSGSGEW